jgi:hypothetical protein
MKSKDLPTTTPRVIEGEARPIVDTTADALHLFTCLAVGGGIEATELLLAHTRAWQERFAATPRLLPPPGEQSATDLVRYALIGLIFDGEERLRDYTAWWAEQVLRSAETATTVTRPLTDSWLFAPLQGPMRSLSMRMQSDLARLIRRGRMEEAISRVMATEVTDEMITVVIDYLSAKPEVRQLIREQGTSFAGEVVDEVRNQSAAVDNSLESIVRRLLNRPQRQPSPPPAAAG